MNRLFPVLWAVCTALSNEAAGQSPARNTIYSQSGQFVVAGNPLPTARANYILGTGTNWSRLTAVGRQVDSRLMPAGDAAQEAGGEPMLKLDPSYLAASAERVKQAIWDRLNLVGQHRGKVYITLLQPTDPPQDILVMHMRNLRGGVWDYKLEIPEEVQSAHLLRALTHVILLEAANRDGAPQLVGVPLWLREGMVAHLSSTLMEFLFFDQEKRVSVTGRLNEEVENLKREINEQQLFDLEQLSWPGTLKPGPATEKTYRLTAHGLVTELLMLPDGEICLGNMVRLLSRYQNWQFAFLHGFQSHFKTLLDFEKWWAVTSLDLSSGVLRPRRPTEEDLIFRTELDLARWQRVTSMYLGNRGANQEWPFADCYLRLGQILQVPIEWQSGEEGEIAREEIGLQDIMNNMEFSLQVPVIEQRIAQLFGLQLHSPPELSGLVREYRFALEKYLVDREASYQLHSFKTNGAISPVLATRNAVAKLQRLDERREQLSASLVEGDPSPPERVADLRP